MFSKPTAILWYVLLLCIGVTLAIILPPNPITLQALHITPHVYRITILTFILPYGIIWFSAFYAFDKLDQYANKVRRTKEGEAFKRIANGVGVLAWGLAVPVIISIALGAMANHYPNIMHVQILISSYLAMAVSLISFSIISRGSRLLNEAVRARPGRLALQIILLVFAIISVLFVTLVVHAQDAGNNPYHLPLIFLIITLIIPNVYAWYIGLFSVYELYLYSRRATGVLYKHSLSYFTGGVALVVWSAIAVQYLMGAYINKTDLSLEAVLIEMYALLALEAAGFSLISLAAKRLKRLEEV